MVTLLLLAMLVVAVVSLLVTPAYFFWALPGGVPLGNVLVAAGLACGPAIALRVKPGGRWFLLVARGILVASVLWLPLGVLLARDPALNFVNRPIAADFFLAYTIATAAGMIAMLVATLLLVIRSAIELGTFDE